MKEDIEKGLSDGQVKMLQKKYGMNRLVIEKKENFLHKIIQIIKEPMFLLLIFASTVYFILGESKDCIVMLIFVSVIITIEVIQEWKTDNTLKALKNLAQPEIEVLRNGKKKSISSLEIVPGDIMYIFEGDRIPADGKIIKLDDLIVDESSLTGESQGVWKVLDETSNNDYWKKDYCYAGTFVIQGSATVQVLMTGQQTEYGKIGANLVDAKPTPSPLNIQTNKLVKNASIIALCFFFLTIFITFINLSGYDISKRLIKSILSGITIAMAMIPEEFPVIFTIFLSMGAWRLAQNKAIVRKLPAVETLGAISVLCVDKTGTITENKMKVADVFSYNCKPELFETMALACETEIYDPMEIAMLSYCKENGYDKESLFSYELIKEYPFTSELKMMGHIWQKNNINIIAVKGSIESVLPLCQLDVDQQYNVEEQALLMAKKGYRVIAVAKQVVDSKNKIPNDILQTNLTLCGLVGLFDPLRPGIAQSIQKCTNAGIRIIMITGDNGVTASTIAQQASINNSDKIITGAQLSKMNNQELKENVKQTNIFSRVLPEHKMLIIKALKANNEVVAMTGDGVNDAIALKYSDIGIAMGKNGSEVAREAADLILLDDDFSTIISTIEDGRRIYDNIKRAVGYVLTIHIPIALAALVAPLLAIHPSNLLLLPVSVMLLELVIDPTCSIILEREPAEKGIMNRKPRKINEQILNKRLIIKSILLGCSIFIASFSIYLFNLNTNDNVAVARTLGIVTIIIANIFLVQIIGSEYDSFLTSFNKLLKDKILVLIYLFTFLMLFIFIYSPINSILGLYSLTIPELLLTFLLGILSVIWYEIVKYFKRKHYIK